MHTVQSRSNNQHQDLDSRTCLSCLIFTYSVFKCAGNLSIFCFLLPGQKIRSGMGAETECACDDPVGYGPVSVVNSWEAPHELHFV